MRVIINTLSLKSFNFIDPLLSQNEKISSLFHTFLQMDRGFL